MLGKWIPDASDTNPDTLRINAIDGDGDGNYFKRLDLSDHKKDYFRLGVLTQKYVKNSCAVSINEPTAYHFC